jgi:hypothetical protein
MVVAATTGHARLRIGHEWSAMDRPIREFQCRLALDTPDAVLHLIRANSARRLGRGSAQLSEPEAARS